MQVLVLLLLEALPLHSHLEYVIGRLRVEGLPPG
jgi:hypothetical protein